MRAHTAVICAYNNKNPGMYTVDLSAASFFRGRRFRLFQVERLSRFGKIRYHRLDGLARLRDFDHIVFWGDFQNNPLWGAHDFAERRLRRGESPGLDDARREWVSIYLRTREAVGRDKVLMSIGTCFLGADADDHRRLYGDDLRYLLHTFDLIVPRDPLSTEVVRGLGGPESGARILDGLDPVFLGNQLPRADGSTKGRFGCYFHRSRIAGTDALVAAVAAKTGLRPRLLRWFGLKKNLLTHWRYRRLIRRLLGCDFVLTDVYHMAATCLKMRVPVIGVGRKADLQRSTLSDLKKKGLFKSINGEDCYLETESEVTPVFLSAVVERSARLQSEGGLNPALRRTLDEKPDAIGARIRSALARQVSLQ